MNHLRSCQHLPKMFGRLGGGAWEVLAMELPSGVPLSHIIKMRQREPPPTGSAIDDAFHENLVIELNLMLAVIEFHTQVRASRHQHATPLASPHSGPLCAVDSQRPAGFVLTLEGCGGCRAWFTAT
jgi:hypothetical protein